MYARPRDVGGNGKVVHQASSRFSVTYSFSSLDAYARLETYSQQMREQTTMG